MAQPKTKQESYSQNNIDLWTDSVSKRLNQLGEEGEILHDRLESLELQSDEAIRYARSLIEQLSIESRAPHANEE